MSAKILIVDDETGLRDIMSEMLNLLGYDVSCAEDGEAALYKVDEVEPDLIISDIRMPKMDGPTMRSYLSVCEKTAHIPVIFMSGYATNLDTLTDPIIKKPFEVSQLVKMIETVL
jgi:two-component system alkaline phosphatase synthesis response regulator PhoP